MTGAAKEPGSGRMVTRETGVPVTRARRSFVCGPALRRVLSSVAGLLLAAGLPPSVSAHGPSAAAPVAAPVATSVAASQIERILAHRDAEVVESKPNLNKGSAKVLAAKSTPQRLSFIRFKVPQGTAPVSSARLRLRLASQVDTRIAVSRSARKWRESTVTFNTAPNVRARVAEAHVSAGSRWVTVDVSAYVDGPGIYSFAVLGLKEKAARFKSSESARPPRLLLSTKAVPQPPSLKPPIRAAFFYPWFPQAWDQGGAYPFTQFTPSLGLYDSSDPATINQQVALATNAGLEAFIASWWGTGHYTDTATLAVLDAIPSSPNPDFRVGIYYEEEGQSNPSAGAIVEDLKSLERLFDKPAYLRIGGKPVVFVWAESSDGAGMTARWADAKARYGKGLHVVMKVYPGYRDDPHQPDSWHQYGPAAAYSEHLPWSAVVSPGFWHAEESSPRLVRNPSRFRTDVRQMAASGAFWQLVTSWNEWGEGTSIEPAKEWGTTYLDVLADELG